MDELDLARQQAVEAMLDDGVRLPAAHFHERPRARRQRGAISREDLGRDAPVAVLVEVLHRLGVRHVELVELAQLLEER